MAPKKAIDDQSVLMQALLVISKQGVENFTLADIGSAVGLSPATLMQRFGSKQKLLVLAAKQAYIKLTEDLEALKKKKMHWNKELLHLLSEVPEGLTTREEIASSLGVLKLDMTDPELHPIARKLFEALRKRIQELLTIGQIPGDTEMIARELDALRHGLIIQWTLSGNGTLQKWLVNGFNTYLKRIKK